MKGFSDDTEWHSFIECPCNSLPRLVFSDAFPRFYNDFFPRGVTFDSSRISMAKIFQEAQFNRYLTNELARYVNGILVCRQRAFSSMSKGGPLSLLGRALEELRDGPEY